MLKRLPVILAAIALLSAGGPSVLNAPGTARAQDAVQEAAAREETTLFTVENMTCARCPVAVKKAMAGVPDVKSVTVDFDARTATATFDPSAVSAADIAAAFTNAGYPAQPAG